MFKLLKQFCVMFGPLFALLLLLSSAVRANAQASLPIYTDYMVNGFQDWGWANRNLANPSPTHSGADSISVTTAVGTALSFEHSDFNVTPYGTLVFWANGGSTGGQRLEVTLQYGPYGAFIGPAYEVLPALPFNLWQKYSIPLGSLEVAGVSNYNRITIKLTGSGTTGTFYVDDIQLNPVTAPALVHVGVDATLTNRPADARWAGINTATWDSSGLDVPSSLSALSEMGIQALRWPGGSSSDYFYHWALDPKNANFDAIATNLGAKVFITVNYGSGSSNEAAAWVLSANTTNHCGFKYWEIGNECYGTWETDTNIPANDPYTYAVRAAGYMALMKKADPTIKVGVVAAPGEDSYANNTNHFEINPRTGTTNYGWTPIMLATLKSLGARPDFLVDHVYPEYTPTVAPPAVPPANDSDALVLQSTAGWASDAADLRQQINDYFGSGGTNIELVATENNSDSGAFGRQLTSIVNGLYLADSVCQIMKTEFNAYLWWDLRNGQSSSGSFDSTVYGWRAYGDEGVLSGTNKYPTFYAEKLLQFFVRPGDTVLNATSDYLLLSAYATRKANGSLAFLVINKDVTATFTAQVSLANFTPWSTNIVRSFGIQQDEATRTNNPTPGSQDIATNYVSAGAVFTNSFPPGSITLFTFKPGPAQLAAAQPQPGQFVLQLRGQPGTPYIIQNSTNLLTWTQTSTNLLVGNVLNITNPISPGTARQFWRAMWQP